VKSSFQLGFLESVPEVAAKLKELNSKDRKFEDVVKDAEQAAVLVLVYQAKAERWRWGAQRPGCGFSGGSCEGGGSGRKIYCVGCKFFRGSGGWVR